MTHVWKYNGTVVLHTKMALSLGMCGVIGSVMGLRSLKQVVHVHAPTKNTTRNVKHHYNFITAWTKGDDGDALPMTVTFMLTAKKCGSA